MATPDSVAIAYDEELQALLDTYTTHEMLREGQDFVVNVKGNAARYNSSMWFAMRYRVRYSYDGELFTLHGRST